MAIIMPNEKRFAKKTARCRQLFLNPCLIRCFSVSKLPISVRFFGCFIMFFSFKKRPFQALILSFEPFKSSLVCDCECRFVVVLGHVLDDLGRGVLIDDVRLFVVLECGKDAALCIFRAVASMDADAFKSGHVQDERERPLEAFGVRNDALVCACGDCRLSGNFRARADCGFHGVADEMALRVVFPRTPCLEVGVEVFVGNLHPADGAVREEDFAFDVDVDAFEFHG